MVEPVLEGVRKMGEKEGLMPSASITPKTTFCKISLNGSMAAYRSRSAPVFLPV